NAQSGVGRIDAGRVTTYPSFFLQEYPLWHRTIRAPRATQAASKAAPIAASLRWIRSASAKSPVREAAPPMKRERLTSSRRKKRAKPVARAVKPAAKATGPAVRAAAAAAPAARSALFDLPLADEPHALIEIGGQFLRTHRRRLCAGL